MNILPIGIGGFVDLPVDRQRNTLIRQSPAFREGPSLIGRVGRVWSHRRRRLSQGSVDRVVESGPLSISATDSVARSST